MKHPKILREQRRRRKCRSGVNTTLWPGKNLFAIPTIMWNTVFVRDERGLFVEIRESGRHPRAAAGGRASWQLVRLCETFRGNARGFRAHNNLTDRHTVFSSFPPVQFPCLGLSETECQYDFVPASSPRRTPVVPAPCCNPIAR
jgi:hypothetical protein